MLWRAILINYSVWWLSPAGPAAANVVSLVILLRVRKNFFDKLEQRN